MTENRLLRAGLFALLASLAVPAQAAPLHFVDGVDGTLTEGAPFPVLQLGVGANTVSGTSFVNLGAQQADFDSFEFVVPAKTRLESISYTPTDVSNPNMTFLRIETFLDVAPSFTSLACQEVFVVNKVSASPTCVVPPGNTLDAPLPVDAGTYLLFEGQYLGNNASDTTWNYTWTLNVDPVPEPGTLAVFSVGLLLALETMRRRRRI
jgi:hypothetical protein